MKKLLVLLFVLGVGLVVMSFRWPIREARPAAPRGERVARSGDTDQGRLDPAPHTTTGVAVPAQEIITPLAGTSTMTMVKSAGPTNVNPPAPAVPVAVAPRPKHELMNPLAREAMSLV